MQAADGSTAEARGDILVAADGIRSAIRARMYPDEGEPRWGGAIMWRFTCPGVPIRSGASFVGLGGSGSRRVGGYSMGMRQRLALATALLGDPPAIVLDEPANGLDPEGIVWLRRLLRAFADQGRTVLVSSHVLTEVQHTVDDVVIIAQGRLVHASSLAALAELAEPETYVEAPAAGALAALAADRGWSTRGEGGGLVVTAVGAAEIGAAAHAAGLELHQLASRGVGLEDVFLRLTGGAA